MEAGFISMLVTDRGMLAIRKGNWATNALTSLLLGVAG